ncbi:XdhC family protein [Actinoplanes regularis]|uniref:Xanthine dehydrogenase accessory factor n=1 Tax=Actinoplanes regularis TaxID=52697 RepID=A0A238ZY76_9ACTN|nr:XdhC/CoxI family protein [Actinoplanes regularis]GIE90209.1 xanthine dehydrogenase [Actinoplanes regularis]SNR87603.1 xanthine dehydrogenase accessory factor [Actinoplanes regularis]
MRDIVDGLAGWRAAGLTFAVATVVHTWRSAPRQPGAAMAVNSLGEVLGSVSGGCVEGAVHAAAEETIKTGKPRSLTYGVSDGDAFDVGLTCGGTVEVLVQPDSALAGIDDLLADITAGRPVATASVPGAQLIVRTAAGVPEIVGTLGDADLDRIAALRAAGLLAQGRTAMVRACDREIFVQTYATPPRMIVFGAIDFAAAVARIGRFLGYRVTVCDARPVFATPARFPEADEVIVQWPHRYLASTEVDARTVLCVLTHDPKFDIPLLEVALRTPAAYIGAMGSRRTCADRVERLREAGVPESALARLRAPIGLDLGARTPEETAVAVASEIIALSWGGSGLPLTALTAPIHG